MLFELATPRKKQHTQVQSTSKNKPRDIILICPFCDYIQYLPILFIS